MSEESPPQLPTNSSDGDLSATPDDQVAAQSENESDTVDSETAQSATAEPEESAAEPEAEAATDPGDPEGAKPDDAEPESETDSDLAEDSAEVEPELASEDAEGPAESAERTEEHHIDFEGEEYAEPQADTPERAPEPTPKPASAAVPEGALGEAATGVVLPRSEATADVPLIEGIFADENPEPAITKGDEVAAVARSGSKLVALISLAVVGLFAVAYFFAHAAADNKIPRGSTVAGVEIGGQTAQEALATLEEQLPPRLDRPVTLRVADTAAEVTADQTGFELALADTVLNADARSSWSPAWLWRYFTGGDEITPVTSFEDKALDQVLVKVGKGAVRRPVEGGISFKAGEIVVTQPESGQKIDPETARKQLTEAFLAVDATDVELPVVPAPPQIDQVELDAALESFAKPAMSGPVTLQFGDAKPVAVSPADFSPALRMVAVDGELVPEYRGKVLKQLVAEQVSTPDAPVDAQVKLVGNKIRIVPDKPGVGYDPEAVAQAFGDAVVATGDARAVTVSGEVTEAKFTTDDAEDLKITEKVSEFTTYYPYAEYRNINIGRAAELIDGTVLKPGEVFSLNGTVGERTRKNGFTNGFIISNGVFKEDLGGGVSQMATTLFNAAFFAGLKDVEHKPHSFYIDRYPPGREATVAWGAVDLRFENDTPYGVLIDTRVIPGSPSRQGTVIVHLYSTKHWDITAKSSGRYRPTRPATRIIDTADCVPNEGYGGFDIDVYRYFRKPGSREVEKKEKFHTRYIPSDTVICEPLPRRNGRD